MFFKRAPVVNPDEVLKLYNEGYELVDVRSSKEFHGELSHVPNSYLVTLGPDLDKWFEDKSKDTKVIFICRSGARSDYATLQALSKGYKCALNMKGGMILWKRLGLKTGVN